MNNVCECKEKIEFELIDGQPTLMDLYKEMNRLKLENKCLKADKHELQDEISQLRSDNIVLHNKINEKVEYTTMVDGGNDISYMDEYAEGNEELMAKMYEVTSDDYKFGGNDIKTN